MITNLFLDIIKALCGFIISVLPPFSVHLPDAAKSLVGFLMGFDAILPVTETVTVCTLVGGLVAALSLVKWTIKIVDYIADVIP